MTPRNAPVVFLGPTLNPAAAQKICDAEFRPPAAMGDVTRAVSEGAGIIVLIDGVFEDRPSVWHKEILWALSKGTGVVGAASMGALRAAELHDQGMLGYGRIYEAYTSGELQDDDEVAVVHGPAETGYLALSDAMVDIRDVVGQAATLGVLTDDESATAIACAKTLHFKARNLNTALCASLKQSRSMNEVAEVLAWFANRPAGAKARDARDLLVNLAVIAMRARELARNAPRFVPTVYLHRLEAFGYREQQRGHVSKGV